jgi:hypothetical protein
VDNDDDNERFEVDDDDDVRIDDVLRELVNKESSETVTEENCCNNDEAGCDVSSKILVVPDGYCNDYYCLIKLIQGSKL